MNRFFRSAFFPLLVIVLLAWLAYKVLGHNQNPKPITYSQLIQKAQQHEITGVVFQPTKNEIDATLLDRTKVAVNYPTDQSATQFQNLLEDNKIPFDSDGISSSPWWGLLTGILPFLLLIGFWIFLMNQV